MTARHLSIEEDRVRRLLFVLTISYLISGWMLNLEYAPRYFIGAAAMAAFHRYLIGKQKLQPQPEGDETVVISDAATVTTAVVQQPLPASGSLVATMVGKSREPSVSKRQPFGFRGEEGEEFEPNIRWNQLGIVDLALMWGITEAAGYFWGYICKTL